MQQLSTGDILYSASDLVNFLDCEHLTTFDLIDLETPLPRSADSDEALLIQAKGFAHEAQYVTDLKARHAGFIDIARSGGSNFERGMATAEAMKSGAEVIYQATLRDGAYIGHADFLRKVPQRTRLGPYGYEVVDTKLSRNAKAKFIVQLAFYSAIIAKLQGEEPQLMHLVLGDHSEQAFRYSEYARYFSGLSERFLARVNGGQADTYPEPCERCDLCKYRELCEGRRVKDDHLSLVANITKLQTKRLQAASVTTLEKLANVTEGASVPKIAQVTLQKLQHQASLQLKARQTGKCCHELLPSDPEGLRGFARLPAPDEGDLCFDMEGDPFEEDGLEYLFGVGYFDPPTKSSSSPPQGERVGMRANWTFKPFWAHSRSEERTAFESFMDFVTARLSTFPNAHIYHYAHYEPTALKRLMSLHGTREAEVDNLLRAGKLVDLYKVVREGMRVSEPRYSIKNIEHFYMEDRAGNVKSAGASTVFYERWKETRDPQLLHDIESYNHDDVRSTYELREWLVKLRPDGMLWATRADNDNARPEVGILSEVEQRLLEYRRKLVDQLATDRSAWGPTEHLYELTYQLLDFHRRCAKPAWWAMFERREMTEDELIDDVESLAGLTSDPKHPPRLVRRSIAYTYLYPEQETKLKSGDSAVVISPHAPANDLAIDEQKRRVTFTCATKRGQLPDRLSIGPAGPLDAKPLTAAVFRFADSVIAADRRYTAIEAFLTQAVPRIRRLEPGQPILEVAESSRTQPLKARTATSSSLLPQIIDRISNLDHSYIFIQGPPGAGKTFTGAHVIVALVEQGFRVGVTSNSHRAINNLLSSVEKVAEQRKLQFRGAKKSTNGAPDTEFGGEQIEDFFNNDEVIDGSFDLVAGTAWFFADPRLDQQLDYLFVDEAGQVALANLIAMGTSARNIVLLGDQMQLGQPIQGVHPGRSGESSLEYLLDGVATIAPERGIFLNTTWRMHPDVCKFISDAVYDSRLEPRPENSKQRLLLNARAHTALAPTGLRFVPIEHDTCSQRSEQEAALVKAIFSNLLSQRYRDKTGKEYPIGLENVLIVAPYNMQVNLLKQVLPSGARVGTVDKFQGQEAEVVIVSMTTSSGDYLPRHIEFLFSKNRLNVAVSRAKSLAIVIANPALLSIHCSKPEEMALVNMLCWVRDYGASDVCYPR